MPAGCHNWLAGSLLDKRASFGRHCSPCGIVRYLNDRADLPNFSHRPYCAGRYQLAVIIVYLSNYLKIVGNDENMQHIAM